MSQPKQLPDFSIERQFIGKIIGVDEAGRGPLAGPVVAAAVSLDNSALELDINDSKKLSPKKRAQIFDIIISKYKYAVGIATVAEIDEINILNATMLAMRRAITALDLNASMILIDGNVMPFQAENMMTVIGGDAKSISIAAASIVAKVTRDKLMLELDKEFPQYGWSKNSAYGTKTHIEAIKQHGPCVHHRKKFISKIAA